MQARKHLVHIRRNRGFPIKLGFRWLWSRAGPMHRKLATAEMQTSIFSGSNNLQQTEGNENEASVDFVHPASLACQVRSIVVPQAIQGSVSCPLLLV